MKKVSCASLRRLLQVGAEFSAEFLRGPMVVRGNCGDVVLTVPEPSRRRVVSQSASQMASVHLDGPKAGRLVYCNWRGVTVREEDGGYILTDNNAGAEDFLRITSIVRSVVAVLAVLMLSGCASTRQAIVATWEPMPEARVAYMVEIGGDRH